MIELEFLYFKIVRVPKFRFFPFIWKKNEELISACKGKIQSHSIVHIEEVANPDGEIYDNLCCITIEEVGMRTVNLPYEKMYKLLEKRNIGYENT